METEIQATVTRVYPRGRNGPYAVAVSKTVRGSITLSLKPDCWQGSSFPEPGDIVLLSCLRRKQAGLRASTGRPDVPSV